MNGKVKKPRWNAWIKIPILNRKDRRQRLLCDPEVESLMRIAHENGRLTTDEFKQFLEQLKR